MVKRNIPNKAKKVTVRKKAMKRSRQSQVQNRAVASIDAGAAMFARLLRDPCNAPMCSPTYGGMGTGEYRRYRSIFKPAVTAVEGSYIFTPGANAMNSATHIAVNAGTNYTYANAAPIVPNTNFTQLEARCLAACVKIRYTGSELNRAGVIGLRTAPHQYVSTGQVSNYASDLALCSKINRLGEVLHEVKFVPGIADEQFTEMFISVSSKELGSFGFTWSGVPGDTLQVEITMVIEQEVGFGLVPAITTPASRNTTNQVLSALGPPVNWAFGHLVYPTLKSVASSAMQSISQTGAYSAGNMLLTL